jgi:hypothetical protein
LSIWADFGCPAFLTKLSTKKATNPGEIDFPAIPGWQAYFGKAHSLA